MQEVYSVWRLLWQLAKTSVSHVGAGATSAALREQLLAAGIIRADDYDSVFAAARLTPGTNLLALFAGLGRLVGGLGGALAALTLGSLPAVLVSAAVCIAYLRFESRPEADGAIVAASAAALSVLVWAAIRFLKTSAIHNPRGALGIAIAVVALQAVDVPPVLLLLGGAAAGAVLFKAGNV